MSWESALAGQDSNLQSLDQKTPCAREGYIGVGRSWLVTGAFWALTKDLRSVLIGPE
jgi:hypothetical protein